MAPYPLKTLNSAQWRSLRTAICVKTHLDGINLREQNMLENHLDFNNFPLSISFGPSCFGVCQNNSEFFQDLKEITSQFTAVQMQIIQYEKQIVLPQHFNKLTTINCSSPLSRLRSIRNLLLWEAWFPLICHDDPSLFEPSLQASAESHGICSPGLSKLMPIAGTSYDISSKCSRTYVKQPREW